MLDPWSWTKRDLAGLILYIHVNEKLYKNFFQVKTITS